ncbi:MAG: ArsR/SmtB family transcription factor [Myxococcaceae bacterium]
MARGKPSVVGDPGRAQHLSDILKAVAHPLRLRIVAALCASPSHVNALAEQLDTPQAIVSQQLRILRMHRLVTAERDGGKALYRILEPQLRSLLSCMEGCRTR